MTIYSDFGYKRYCVHHKEHWDSYFTPYKEYFYKTYNIDLFKLIEDMHGLNDIIYGLIKIYLRTMDWIDKEQLSKDKIVDLYLESCYNEFDKDKYFNKVQLKIAQEILRDFYKNYKIEHSDEIIKIARVCIVDLRLDTKHNFLSIDYNNIINLLISSSSWLFKIDDPLVYFIKQNFVMTACKFTELYKTYIDDNTSDNDKQFVTTTRSIGIKLSEERFIGNFHHHNYKKLIPFIKLSEGSFIFNSELFINYIDKIITNNMLGNSEQYKDHGVNFENTVKEFFSNIFKTVTIYHGYKYKNDSNPSTDGIEIDLIVVVDNIVLICECKAGKILFTENSFNTDDNPYNKGIEQLEALINKLENDQKIIFRKANCDDFELQKSNFRHVIPIVITEDELSFISNNIKKTNKVVCYSINDLRIIRDVLGNNIEIIQFILETLIFNSKTQDTIKRIDCVDLLEYYLANALLSSADEVISSKDVAVVIADTSDNQQINEYFFNKKFNLNTPYLVKKVYSEVFINFLNALCSYTPKDYLSIGLDFILLYFESLSKNKEILKDMFDIFKSNTRYSCVIYLVETNNYVLGYFISMLNNTIIYNMQADNLASQVIKDWLLSKVENTVNLKSCKHLVIYLDNDMKIQNIEIHELDCQI